MINPLKATLLLGLCILAAATTAQINPNKRKSLPSSANEPKRVKSAESEGSPLAFQGWWNCVEERTPFGKGGCKITLVLNASGGCLWREHGADEIYEPGCSYYSVDSNVYLTLVADGTQRLLTGNYGTDGITLSEVSTIGGEPLHFEYKFKRP